MEFDAPAGTDEMLGKTEMPSETEHVNDANFPPDSQNENLTKEPSSAVKGEGLRQLS